MLQDIVFRSTITCLIDWEDLALVFIYLFVCLFVYLFAMKATNLIQSSNDVL
jgi:hypothetical protein